MPTQETKGKCLWIFTRQNGQRAELCAQGNSAFQAQEEGGGSLKGEDSQGIKCWEARSTLPIFQKGGKLEETERQAADEGLPVW